MRWTRQRLARDGVAGWIERSVSDQRAGGREMLQRTAKSCGPDAPTLASSLRSCVGPTGLRQNISAGDGGKRARSPGRARHKPLKPLRAGMPGVPVYSLLLVCVLPIQSAHEAAGATGTRHSPRPLWGGRFINGSGALRRGVAKPRLMRMSAPHSQPSSPAKAGDPVFRGASDRIEKPQRTGYSALAEYVDSLWSSAAIQVRHVIASREADEAIHTPSFRGDAKHRTRNLEIPGLVLRTIPE
jgi:hypothetical protein